MKLLRKIKYLFQRLFFGFSDSDLYNLDYIISKWILPRLKRFKKINFAIPSALCGPKESNIDESSDLWDSILEQMIFGFEVSKNEWDHNYTDEEYQIAQEGLELFGIFYGDLWI